jgi:magnesium chelatase family protein
MNPCPCGRLGDGTDRCTCDPTAVRRYAGRVSGPLLDRIDLHVHVPAVALDALAGEGRGEPSATVAERVAAARGVQRERHGADRGGTNAELAHRRLHAALRWSPQTRGFAQAAAESLGLSARGYHRLLRVARTVADLRGCEAVERSDVAEAVQYRSPPSISGGAG